MNGRGECVGAAGSLRAALRELAGLGPFFEMSADPTPWIDPTWRPCRELYTDPEVLGARIELVARSLGTTEPRVAASIACLGLAARLVSPVLAVAAGYALVPRWTPDSLHWRPVAGGPLPLWESAGSIAHAGADGLPAAVAEVLVEPHLAALVEATRAVVSVSTRVLWGNAASALVGAAGLVGRARPAAAHRAAEVLDGVLATAPLAGTGHFESRWSFRRRSCCLYYRVPGGDTCGDCVLATRGR